MYLRQGKNSLSCQSQFYGYGIIQLVNALNNIKQYSFTSLATFITDEQKSMFFSIKVLVILI